jgi:DNA-binding IscR family transcriptional regulator
MLARANILTAQRGSGGGFALAKVPTAIRVLDVLNATDSGVSRIERCPLGIVGHTRLCALHQMLDEQVARAEQVFAMTSIASLLAGVDDIRPLCQVPGAGPLEPRDGPRSRVDRTRHTGK